MLVAIVMLFMYFLDKNKKTEPKEKRDVSITVLVAVISTILYLMPFFFIFRDMKTKRKTRARNTLLFSDGAIAFSP